MNKVTIDFERCKECGYCIHFCPKGALTKGTEINKHSYFPPVFDAEKCIACGTCARVCPDTAIEVYKEV
ncbi:MAG: 4Fe-4S binding protein [Eubacteriales bacterium]|nr:4Fe-4S binding protein [Eubacteriales bacterium]